MSLKTRILSCFMHILSTVLSLYGRIRFSENSYSPVFCGYFIYDFVLKRKNTGQCKLSFSHIFGSAIIKVTPQWVIFVITLHPFFVSSIPMFLILIFLLIAYLSGRNILGLFACTLLNLLLFYQIMLITTFKETLKIYDCAFTQENMGQWKLVFSHILCSAIIEVTPLPSYLCFKHSSVINVTHCISYWKNILDLFACASSSSLLFY